MTNLRVEEEGCLGTVRGEGLERRRWGLEQKCREGKLKRTYFERWVEKKHLSDI